MMARIRIGEDDDDVEEDQDDHYRDDAGDKDDYNLAVDVPLQHWMALTEDHQRTHLKNAFTSQCL